MWLKVWFNKLEKAESENSDFFELLEEEELDAHRMLNNCDIIKNGSILTEEASEIYDPKDRLNAGTENLSTNDDFGYTDNILHSMEDKDDGSSSILSNPQSTTNWITFEDTYQIKQRKWSQDSSASSISSSSVASTSCSEMSSASFQSS